VGIRKHYSKERLLCRDIDNNEFYVSVEHTNAGKNDDSDNSAMADCDFRYEDLLSLLDIISSINVK
jgi:hypothetical protein